MKIQPVQKKKIISVPDDCTSIHDIVFDKEEKTYVYNVEYDFDILKVLSSNIKTVKISVYNSRPVAFKSRFIKSPSRRSEIVRNLNTFRRAARRNTGKQKINKNKILSRMSDITAHIDNRYTRKNITKDMLPIRTVVRSLRTSTLSKVQSNISMFTSPAQSDDSSTPSSAASSMIFGQNISPDSIVSSQTPVISVNEAMQGVSSVSQMGHSNSFSDMLFSSINNAPDSSHSNMIPIPVIERQETKKVIEKIEIDNKKLTGLTFYIKFDVYNSNKIKIQTVIRKVNHSEEIGYHKKPVMKPSLSVSRVRDGLNAIEVIQKDRNGTAIFIQYREVNPGIKLGDTEYKNLGSFSCDYNTGAHLVKHNVGTNLPIIYRAISMNDAGGLSGEFSSTVFSPFPGINYLSKMSGAIVSATLNSNSIKIQSFNIPEDISGWGILRKNLTKKEKKYRNITSMSNSSMETGSVSYIDGTVTHGEIYEYKIEFYDMYGTSAYTSNSSVVEFIERSDLSTEVDISEFKMIPSSTSIGGLGQRFTVSMTLNVEFGTVNDAKDLFDLIAQAGLSEMFDADLATIKNSLLEIANFKIVKIDMTRGKIYNLGIHPAGQFIDSFYTTRTPLLPGSAYKYVVSLFLTNPSQMIKEIPKYVLKSSVKVGNSRTDLRSAGLQTISLSSATKNVSTLSSATTMPQLSLNPIASQSDMGSSTLAGNTDVGLKKTSIFNPNYPDKFFTSTVSDSGTLSYGDAAFDNHAESIIEAGYTGVSGEVETSIPDYLPSVSSGNVFVKKHRSRRIRKELKELRQTILKWDLDGEKKRIDHFLVNVENEENTYTIASVHNISNNGTYKFIDRKHRDHVGTLSYFIVPIYLNYEPGESFFLGEVEY
jgi:hypothetical protein